MLLARYMQLRELTDAKMAELVGCTESAIYKLRVQQNRPSLETAYQIEQVTQKRVRLADWQYEPKNRFWNKRIKTPEPAPAPSTRASNGKASSVGDRGRATDGGTSPARGAAPPPRPAAAPPARKRKADGGASLQA